jgi:hypothetical protein
MGAAAAGAGVAAAGAIGGSLLSSSAASSAAKTQAGAANQAAQLQLQEQQKVRDDLTPFRNAGGDSTSLLARMLYGGEPDLMESTLENTPGFQFALKQGLQSTQNSAAARGLGTSGAALKGAATFAEGLAQGTYKDSLLNPLMSLAGLGENAAAKTGELGTTGAANAGAGLVGAGNASAAGTVGSANAISSGLNTAGGIPLNYLLYDKLLGNGGFYVNGSTNSGPGGEGAYNGNVVN